jgi:hypothetical protein
MNNKGIQISVEQKRKLDWISRAIDENPSHQRIIDGLIETGFATALKTLRQSGLINQTEYQHGIMQIPQFLQVLQKD